MSKELTEQWEKGKLKTGWYYFKTKSLEVKMGYQYKGLKYPYSDWCHVIDDVVRVLAPVPAYDQFVDLTEKANQFSQMVTKCHRLEQQLEEAEEVIRLYFKNTQKATHQSLGMNDGYYKKAFMHTVAKEYLEKYGVEK